ncbi:MAG: glycosyltransferase family 4 protein [Balneolales bacterium]|nr:glycosyltransferase family 4 protein [Balneolales bacterium]
MNINIISCANTRCGIGRYTNEMATRVIQRNQDVTVLRKDSPEPPHFKVYPYRSFRNFRHYVAPYYLGRAIRDLEADIWHADYVDAASALFWAHKTKDLNLFVNVHDAIPFVFPTDGIAFQNYKAQLNFAKKRTKKLIVVSEQSKKDLVKYAGAEPDKVEVIYNGINHSEFYPDPLRRKREIFTIRYMGGLSVPHKNTEALIEVARILEAKGYTFEMQIGGGHPENTKLPGLVEKYGLTSVSFTGFIPDEEMRSFLAEADVFLYPSKYEGFGFPPLEAMACGAATISSNAGSLAEVLGEGALTVQPEVDYFVKAIEMVMMNPELKYHLEERGIKQARKYTWEKSADQHLALFHNALSLSKSGRKAS